MDGIGTRESDYVFLQLGQQAAAIEVDLTLYSIPALLRTCYKFTDRAYFYLERGEQFSNRVVVSVGIKSDKSPIGELIGELCNELVDQQIRQNLAQEAGAIRTLIVAQAFSEGNLLDAHQDAGDYETDPLNIGRQK